MVVSRFSSLFYKDSRISYVCVYRKGHGFYKCSQYSHSYL